MSVDLTLKTLHNDDVCSKRFEVTDKFWNSYLNELDLSGYEVENGSCKLSLDDMLAAYTVAKHQNAIIKEDGIVSPEYKGLLSDYMSQLEENEFSIRL